MQTFVDSPLSEQTRTSIAAALQEQPLCREIILFLLENEAALDTVRGIAAWWVRCDWVPVQAALDRLMACGVISAHTLISGTLYGLTQHSGIRTWLRATYGTARKPTSLSSDDGERLMAESP